MKKSHIIYFFCMFFIVSGVFARTYYVSPAGKSSNSGNSFDSPIDFFGALSKVTAGDSILLHKGTYIIDYSADTKNTIYFTKSGEADNPIFVIAVDSSHAVFDFSFPEQAWVQDSYGFEITGSYWYFKGIDITRAGYQGVYIKGSNNTFENCAFYNNRNTGMEINKGGSYTTVINCDAYQNYDPKKLGSMADGFGPKQTQGPGNKFIGCRAWENSDDGFDCYDSPEIVTFENCWTFRNGVDIWQYGGFDGNGNGFKVGGNYQEANHKLTNCVAFEHPGKGFDQNNNSGGLIIYNCTSYDNGRNYGLGNSLNTGQTHILKNNISLSGPNSISNAIEEHNSWNTGFSVSEDDFKSLDLTLAETERNADGTLQQTDLFSLKPTSLLIDAGVDVGLPYKGNAPDLGYHESEYTGTGYDELVQYEKATLNIYPNPVGLSANLTFKLLDQGIVSVFLYDMSGTKHVVVADQNYPAGMNIIEFYRGSLPAGVYLCKIEVDGRVVSNKKLLFY